MELNDETTVKGFLIIVNFALCGICITIWKAREADKKEYIKLAKEYIESMKQLIPKNIRNGN